MGTTSFWIASPLWNRIQSNFRRKSPSPIWKTNRSNCTLPLSSALSYSYLATTIAICFWELLLCFQTLRSQITISSWLFFLETCWQPKSFCQGLSNGVSSLEWLLLSFCNSDWKYIELLNQQNEHPQILELQFYTIIG